MEFQTGDRVVVNCRAPFIHNQLGRVVETFPGCLIPYRVKLDNGFDHLAHPSEVRSA